MVNAPSPFVFWAQTESQISLKVDLKDAKSPDISIKPEKLTFLAFGKGARGEHKYSFTLNFFGKLNPDECNYKIFDRQIELILKKCENGFWPRLTGAPQKPAWLKIDFDKWKSDDPDIDEEENRNIMDDYPDLYDQLEFEERGYRIENYKKVYLVLYNLIQLVGFTYVLTVIGVKYLKDGSECVTETYENVGLVMKLCHLLMWLEVLHPIFGYTNSSFWMSLMQVGGRNVILFALIEAEPRMQTKPVVFYLFIAWSLVEIVRYPYYICHLNKLEIGLLTWLRYTIWIPLYPCGMLCEGVVILRNILYSEETHRFTISLPNLWNFTFHFPTVLRVYLVIFFLPALYVLMSHMYRDRIKRLAPRNVIRKFD